MQTQGLSRSSRSLVYVAPQPFRDRLSEIRLRDLAQSRKFALSSSENGSDAACPEDDYAHLDCLGLAF